MRMKNLYTIINLTLKSDFSIEFLHQRFKEENKCAKIDFSITANDIKQQDSFFQFYELPNDKKLVLLYGQNHALLDKGWKNIIVNTKEDIEILLLQIYRFHATKNAIIQIHSSLISYQGHGLMFLGPSGIGKTTQAELWNQYRDALIINGDVVFVQETPDAFLGWGTPWHGSSPYCENTSVPVKALIVLKQAPENSIRELTGFEKVTAVSNNVFYPRWLENGMELCLETLNHLLSALPVYELSCRPDEEAVKLTEETIFGK